MMSLSAFRIEENAYITILLIGSCNSIISKDVSPIYLMTFAETVILEMLVIKYIPINDFRKKLIKLLL